MREFLQDELDNVLGYISLPGIKIEFPLPVCGHAAYEDRSDGFLQQLDEKILEPAQG